MTMSMALHGNLRDFAATEILQLLATQKKSGCLLLESEEGATEVFYVLEGRLVSTRHPGLYEPDRLMELLLRANRLSEEQRQGIRTIQKESGRDLEDLLVNGRYLEAEELAVFLERHILDDLTRVVLWKHGTYRFEPARRWPNPPVTSMSVEAGLIEASRRIDEQERFRHLFSDRQQILEVNDLPDPDTHVSDDELELFEIIDGRHTLADVIAAAPLLEYETLEALYRMFDAGWVKTSGRRSPQLADWVPPQGSTVKAVPAHRSAPRVLAREVAFAAIVVGVGLGLRLLAGGLHAAPGSDSDDLHLRTRLRDVRNAIEMHRYETGRYPARLEDLVAGRWIADRQLRLVSRPLTYRVDHDGKSYTLTFE